MNFNQEDWWYLKQSWKLIFLLMWILLLNLRYYRFFKNYFKVNVNFHILVPNMEKNGLTSMLNGFKRMLKQTCLVMGWKHD
jgi:hypothetical protein